MAKILQSHFNRLPNHQYNLFEYLSRFISIDNLTLLNFDFINSVLNLLLPI